MVVAVSETMILKEDFLQMKKIFKQHGLSLVLDDPQAEFFIDDLHIDGHYKELYSRSADDLLYFNIRTDLDVTIKEKFSQDIVLSRKFSHIERFSPNQDFYSQQDWYKAQVQFESQQHLFYDLATDLTSCIKQHAKVS